MKSSVIYIPQSDTGGNQNGVKFTVSAYNETRFKSALVDLPYSGTVIYKEDQAKGKVTFTISAYKLTSDQLNALEAIS